MPRLTTRNIPLNCVIAASSGIQSRISSLLAVPAETVVISVSSDPYVHLGNVRPSFPFVDIAMFDRGTDKQDAIATIITEELAAAGCPEVDLYFTRYESGRYYENGARL